MNLVFSGALKTLNKRPKWMIFVFIAAIFLLAVVLTRSGSTVDKNMWMQAERGNFAVEIIESGEIRAINSVSVSAPRDWSLNLQIVDMATEGSVVKKGDFLVQFDTSDLEEDLKSSRDNLAKIMADLKRLETEHSVQMSGLKSNLQMAIYSKEAAELRVELLKYESKNRQEDAKLNLEKELINFEEAHVKIKNQEIINAVEHQKKALLVEQYRNVVKDIEERIKNQTLYAPIGGMVVYNEIGGWGSSLHKVAIGDEPRPGRPIISIPDLTEMEMVAKVNEIDITDVTIGQKSFIRLDAFEKDIFHGVVTGIAQFVEKQKETWRWRRDPQAAEGAMVNVATFDVTIRIDETDLKLKPGMTAQGRIILEEIADVVYVPIGSVFETIDGTTVVFKKQNFPKPTVVAAGKRNDRFMIINKGVNESDIISVSSPGNDYYPLGWHAEMQRRESELQELLAHIDTMYEQGVTGVVDKNNSQGTSMEIPPHLKMISDILDEAGCSLLPEQIEKLEKLEPGPESMKKLGEILNTEQKKALRNARKSRGNDTMPGRDMRGGVPMPRGNMGPGEGGGAPPGPPGR